MGPPGMKGDRGIGIDGLPGRDGRPGWKGDRGGPGLKGDRGMPGFPGLKGDQGMPGFPGLRGDRGMPGLCQETPPKQAGGLKVSMTYVEYFVLSLYHVI